MQLFITSNFLLCEGLAAASGLFAEKLILNVILILITTSIFNSDPQLVETYKAHCLTILLDF